LSKAEKDLKDYLEINETKITYKMHKELIAINPKHKTQIIKQIKTIGNQYAGCVKELVKKLDNLNHKIEILEEKHKNELMIEKHQKELEIEKNRRLEERIKHVTETLTQKIEIEKLRNQVLIKNKK